MRNRIMAGLGLATLALGIGACDEASSYGPPHYKAQSGTPEAVAYTAGLTRYLGTARPVETQSFGPAETAYTFDPADGPVCMRGAPYAATVRETPSEDLLIFLQGGGACWSDFCLAITGAPTGIPAIGLLNPVDGNPTKDFDVLYLPYCDGSLFAGDSETDENGDGNPDRIQHGLQNLSAALTVGYEHFPHPRRIVLAGSSGGGFGTIMATLLVRYVYPGVPIDVLNDAGLGVAHAGDPSFVQKLITEFGAEAFIPADCPDCIADGNITGLVDYMLARDPDLRVAAISSWYDFVIGNLFLMESPTTFRDDVAAATSALHAKYPGRYQRFLYDGTAHTALLGGLATGILGDDLSAIEVPPNFLASASKITLADYATLSVNGVVLEDWIAAMLANDAAAWTDLVQPAGPPPSN
ncbi:MAG: hypothetical protein U0230_10545 [Polyangiales bacterium]